MSFLSMATLESWLDEFRSLGYPLVGSLKVIEQDGADGADTGLVGVHLVNASTVTYIQPESPTSRRWLITFERREEPVTLPAAQVLTLSTELATASALCAFLQAKHQALTAPIS
ncbi:hypothetical protein [Microbacterium sp. P04]|uniref:hypothetical protein n=1 Tax=Microbacterium sp. P04 TaxID=3366947 RepID=UPI0037453248